MHSDWQLYKRLLGYMLPFYGALILSVIGNILFALMQVLFADIMQLVVDSFGAQNKLMSGEIANGITSNFINNVLQPLFSTQYGPVVWIPCAILVLAFLRGVGSFMGKYYLDVVGRNTVNSLRCSLFEHTLKMPVSFFDQSNSAYLVSRITYNVQQVAQAVTRALMIVIREGFTVIGMLAYMIYLNWRLTLIFLIVVPFIALIISYVSKRFRRLSRRIQGSMGGVTHVSSESFGGIRAVKIFSGEDYETDRFFEVSEYNINQSLKMALTDSVSSPVMQFLIAATLAMLIAYGLGSDLSEGLSSGVFVAFLTAAGLVAKPLKQLGNVLNLVQKGLAAADDIFKQMDQPIEKNDKHYTVERAKGEITITDLFFSYNERGSEPALQSEQDEDISLTNIEDRDVLKNINIHIPAGKTIALVGKSGSGKSTLVNLLPRFYLLERGSILLDQVDINEYELNNLRQQFALVSQHITLFNDTLYNNVAYGALRGSDPDKVHEAMRIAHVNEFVKDMPDGEHTLVGDQGVLLSGGQRQRIAIARAILKDAPVLILDEATSALDNESERYIQQALEYVMQHRTSIVIAHRLSTIENADEILVMEQGEVIERGTHLELLERQGVYAKLHQNHFESDDA